MTLRTRLALALVALTAIGLGVAAVVTYHEVGSFLVQRVDQELASAAQNPNIFFSELQPGAGSTNNVPVGTYAEFRDAEGNILKQSPPLGNSPPPNLAKGAIAPGAVFSVYEPHYRVASVPANIGHVISGTLIVAIPMRDIDDTLHHLLLIELLVAAGVLFALALLAWWVVHMGLRPLERMGETAGAIAGGDLSRRVEPADEKTEVGRLGLALNSMLGQIETAFAERTASETRLRRFVADASHELRTPLTSIRGYAELFRRGANTRPDDLAKTMRRIEEAAARMGVLVDDLLLLARLDQGRPLEHGPVDLTRLVAAAVDDVRATSPERPVTYDATGPVVVNGDEFRLRQVLANLLENARSHTPPATPIDVRVSQAGDTAIVEVRDYGPGMSAEDAARAFERFWRSDPSRTRSSGGAGLGLAIVAAITEAHGGHAEVETAPGEGATFRVFIPLTGPPPAVEPVQPDFELLPEVQPEST
ncbi:MAG TPA: HAMP domain-containing sensor histidine kinase [Acidimicrobiia bacterium]|nr:HAMP domain-containing sensor histidine kinase [Acidimicrobiia bacterium]